MATEEDLSPEQVNMRNAINHYFNNPDASRAGTARKFEISKRKLETRINLTKNMGINEALELKSPNQTDKSNDKELLKY